LFADYTDLQTTTAEVNNEHVVVQVHNPNAVAETTRVRIAVQIEEGIIERLTIPLMTVPASSTLFVTASASATIVQIIEDPQPISP
jgi:hypothetical protein